MGFPGRELGQNFLKEESFLEEIAQAIPKGKNVLEIGAGHGELTKFLAPRAKKLTAIEKDPTLLPALQKTAAAFKNVVSVNADALGTSFKPFPYVAGNIPYSLSSPLLFKILGGPFKEAVLLLQKEFAQRLVAEPGSEGWSRLAVMAQNAAEIKIIDEVPKECFSPVPKVDSLIIHLKSKPAKERLKLDPSTVALLFQHRNQTVRNALLHSRGALGMEKEEIRQLAEKTGLADTKVRHLAPAELETLSKSFYSPKTK